MVNKFNLRRRRTGWIVRSLRWTVRFPIPPGGFQQIQAVVRRSIGSPKRITRAKFQRCLAGATFGS